MMTLVLRKRESVLLCGKKKTMKNTSLNSLNTDHRAQSRPRPVGNIWVPRNEIKGSERERERMFRCLVLLTC